ncbi:phosphoribosylamine--glycine ligase [candidate division WOR-3 bacterium]|nr:phosphoribosylamine--glycine ligase [candidate division WOR-3 bacterium]
MKVFLLGGGGREHALGWKLAQSDKVTELYFLPGNAGTSELGLNIEGNPADAEAVLQKAEEYKPGLIVVGPEAPLFEGIVDRLEAEGFCVFGPNRKAAMLEQEKTFAKEFLNRHEIPTAFFKAFSEVAAARRYIEGRDSALVVKASGPASGKGVIVCDAPQEALAAVDQMMVERKFGKAGEQVVIEERLEGEELSVLVLTDGERFVEFPASQDHKPIGEGDTGQNTGGMGAYAPAPLADSALKERIRNQIIRPVLAGLTKDGLQYRGVLYIGLMITPDGPKVLEFNCRFGDPETQPLMLLMDEDLLPLLLDTAKGTLAQTRSVAARQGSSVCVVAASQGYPGSYQKGFEIILDKADNENLVCFHAGTTVKDGKLITSGGRVLGVTAFASDLREAKMRAYERLVGKRVYFEGIYFRGDIADKGIRRLDGKV